MNDTFPQTGQSLEDQGDIMGADTIIACAIPNGNRKPIFKDLQLKILCSMDKLSGKCISEVKDHTGWN